MFDNSFLHRVAWKLACMIVLPLCLVWGVVRSVTAAEPATQNGASPEQPAEWNGRPVRPLALSDVEQRFAARFPGSLQRFTDGEQVVVLRTVFRPTRMLHPAMDCYRALGWRIAAQRLQKDAHDALWRCFEARQDSRRLEVCEQIVDGQGQVYTDTSAWYWSAVLGESQGAWRAVTTARPLS